MRSYSIFLFALLISIISGCSSNPKSKPVNQDQFKEEDAKLNESLQKKIGLWAKEGADCYGLILLTNKNNSIKYGKSVKTVIVRVKSDSLKVKVLEDVTLGKIKDCSKLGVAVGYTWWEKEGDLFQSREEADIYLKSKGWEFRDKESGNFKIGD